MNKGKIYIISGPSGAGKDTIIDMILKNKKLNVAKAKSYTTREPRNESDKDRYIFIDEETFKKFEKSGEIIESNFYNDNWYGSSKSEIDKSINRGINIVNDIDVNGGVFYKKFYPEATLIFIKTSLEDIKSRLHARGENTPGEIEARIETAKKEMKFENYYDFSVINPNGHPEIAVDGVTNIISNGY